MEKLEKLEDRYKGTGYLKGKRIEFEDSGKAEDILKQERHKIKTNSVPDNKETWRGSGN